MREPQRDHAMRVPAGNVAAAEHDAAAGARDETGDRAERRRLPGPVGTDHGDDLAFRHAQRDALDGGDAAVVTVERADLKQGVVGAR